MVGASNRFTEAANSGLTGRVRLRTAICLVLLGNYAEKEKKKI